MRMTVGDRPQGVAGDCNSLAETHAWFDSRVAHHLTSLKLSMSPPCNSKYISVTYVEDRHPRTHKSPLISALWGYFPESLSRAFAGEVLSGSKRPQDCANPRISCCPAQSNGGLGSVRSIFAARCGG